MNRERLAACGPFEVGDGGGVGAVRAGVAADDRGDRWTFSRSWQGTVAAVEIRTETIADYDNFFQWIFQQIPSRKSATRKIRFT